MSIDAKARQLLDRRMTAVITLSDTLAARTRRAGTPGMAGRHPCGLDREGPDRPRIDRTETTASTAQTTRPRRAAGRACCPAEPGRRS